jgi:hypothetical protein
VVLSPHQNAFFAEIADVLVGEMCAAGADAVVVHEPGAHLVLPDDVFVLLPPHEYVALEGSGFVDDPVVAARTIGLSAEQPHQGFFERNAHLGARLGAVVDFSPLAVDAYRALGIDALHLPFGYTPRWDRRVAGHVSPGPPRVLYLGNKRPRRLGVLAGAADALARHGARLLISDNDAPNRGTGPAFVAGDDKRELLAATRLLVNIHQSDEPYFEWLRFVEAAHCGTPVLSEHSDHSEPFVPGTHFEAFAPADLGGSIDALIDDDDRLTALADTAYEQLRSMPLANSVGVLVDSARSLLGAPPPSALPARTRAEPLVVSPELVVPNGPGTGRTARSAWRRQRVLTLVGDDVDQLAGHLERTAGPVEVVAPGELTGSAVRRLRGDVVLLLPARTRPHGLAFDRFVAAAMVDVGPAGHALSSAVVDGVDAQGAPTLEGIWPWQPWRLFNGQHLGRLMLADGDVVRGAAPWFDDPAMAGSPHFVVQCWAARHGLEGGHLSTPVARVDGTPLDPEQRVPVGAAERSAQLVTTATART